MQLYTWGRAPNPRRVKIFVAEKGLDLLMTDVGDGTGLRADYVAQYPQATVPMLELADGTRIGEAMAICRYLEELHPEPPLMGIDAKSRAVIDMWERRAYDEGLLPAAEIFRNGHPGFVDRALPGTLKIPQITSLIDRGKLRLEAFFNKFDNQLEENAFIAGRQFSTADITALCAITFMKVSKVGIPRACTNLQRWYRSVSKRPSVSGNI